MGNLKKKTQISTLKTYYYSIHKSFEIYYTNNKILSFFTFASFI